MVGLFAEVNPYLWVYTVSLWLRFNGDFQLWLVSKVFSFTSSEGEVFLEGGATDVMLVDYLASYHNRGRSNHYVFLHEEDITASHSFMICFKDF